MFGYAKNFDFQTLIQLEAYYLEMAIFYNHKWWEIGDDDYVNCKMNIALLKAVRKEIENRVDI